MMASWWRSGKEPTCLPVQDPWVQFLHREDPLEKETAIHSSIHAWKIPWTEEPGGLKSMGRKESDMTEQLVCVCVCVCIVYYLSGLF